MLLVFSLSIFIQKVQAQCGDDPGSSSCITCHEKESAYRVIGTGIWHAIHASKDSCWNCHAGNSRVDDKELAHEGILVHPLEDVYTDCYACHPIDYLQRAELFGAILGVTPASRPTSTPVLKIAASQKPIGISYQVSREQSKEPAWVVVTSGFLILGTFLVLLFFLSRSILASTNQNNHIQNP